MQAAGYEKMILKAEYFYFEPMEDYLYTLNVKIVDDHFSMNGIIYEVIAYDNNRYPKFLPFASNIPLEKYEVLLKIQELNSCYVLITEDEEYSSFGFGNPLLVYEMDGDYYFLGCYYEEEWVMRVNKATIK